MCIINQGYRKEKLNVWENEASHHPQGSAVYRLEALFATMLALLKNISAANVKLKAQEQFVIVTIAHLIKPTACAAWRKKSDRSVVEYSVRLKTMQLCLTQEMKTVFSSDCF